MKNLSIKNVQHCSYLGCHLVFILAKQSNKQKEIWIVLLLRFKFPFSMSQIKYKLPAGKLTTSVSFYFAHFCILWAKFLLTGPNNQFRNFAFKFSLFFDQLLSCSWHQKTNSPILQFTNLKCCIKAKEPFKTPFLLRQPFFRGSNSDETVSPTLLAM